jgi:type I restriction enzyme M protein
MSKRHANRLGDLESLFLRLEELVLANSGADEFEEIFKLVVAKLWDERSGRPTRFKAHSRQSETTNAICCLLREAGKAWPGFLAETKPVLTHEHLEICVEALAPHTIEDKDLQVMDGLFEFLVTRTAKGAKGQYFTPRHVVEFCVRMMRPSSDELILDPACGSGGFLIHTLNYVRTHEGLSPDASRRFCQNNLWGFDMDARAVRVAKALMILAGDSNTNILRLNSLLTPSMAGLFSPNGDDDLSLTIEDICRSRFRRHKGFDLILTNPPFAGEIRERQLLDSYTLGKRKPRIERDILFVERCVRLLKPGGRLAIVLPHNKLAANTFAPLRQWLLKNTRILAVVGLGRNTFLPHTHQKASVLFLRRNLPEEDATRDYPIFFAISERDGKNSKGQFLFSNGVVEQGSIWERSDHDLANIVESYLKLCQTGTLAEK